MMKRSGITTVVAAAVLIATPFVAKHEGNRLVAYLDPVGIPTICYGETLGVKMGQVETQASCDEKLKVRLAEFSKQVDDLVVPTITPTTLAALTSFTYNVGVNAFKRSTMLKKINAGDIAGGCREMQKWVYAKGIKWPGLVKRRKEEMELCLAGLQ